MSESTDGEKEKKSQQHILGLSTEQLAGLSIDELTGNKTAITMLVHYYKVLLDENASLKNDLNTAKTYISGYDRKKTNARIGAGLLLVANVGIGFGVNLLSSDVVWPGLATLLPALAMAALGTYYSVDEK